jgi:hypothetical protein
MQINPTPGNALYELAETMAALDCQAAAIALRKLAQAGYISLEEADDAPDWVLLSIPGMGVGRLRALRHLTRPNWQPPTAQAIKVVARFLSAARSAMRYWPVEALEPLIRGAAPNGVQCRPFDSRLAVELFAKAAARARCHCTDEELVQVLRHVQNGHQKCVCDGSGSVPLLGAQMDTSEDGRIQSTKPGDLQETSGNGSPARETDHFAYPRTERLKIVLCYRSACGSGTLENKDQWAQSNYGISGRTLLRYEREFSAGE